MRKSGISIKKLKMSSGDRTMGDRGDQDKLREQFMSPTARYRGPFSPEQLAFNANLQEFAQRISLVCGLETSGKISADEAYAKIKQLWKTLKASKQELLDTDNKKQG